MKQDITTKPILFFWSDALKEQLTIVVQVYVPARVFINELLKLE